MSLRDGSGPGCSGADPGAPREGLTIREPEARELLHEVFSEQARRTPQETALVQGDRHVTFQELTDRVDRLARGLVGEGLGAGSTVGVFMERSVEWVACVLAILKANGAVVPLPPSYPSPRIAEILLHARLDGILEAGDSALDPSLPGRRLSVEELLEAPGAGPVPEGGDPDQAAFVLSSSGSTGRPKMIVRSHRSFFHRLRWTWSQHPYQPGERCCQKSHMTTTHAIYELFEPLLKGVPLVMISDDEVRDLEGFWDTIRARSISRLLIVPSQLQASLALPGFVPPPLRVMVLMGEYVSPALAEQALAAFPADTRIYSIYGSTEASSTLVCDLRESFRPGAELPLGHPIDAAVRALVVAGDGAVVPDGEVGRLHMAGPPLFTEYLGDPERTARVLVRLPELPHAVCDTGDEVRRTAGGNLEFVGRGDRTIKVRGFRVDLQEVERTLLLHPGVRQAAVVASGNGAGTERLVAFVSPPHVDRGEVFGTLRARLPDFMIPSFLVRVDRLPLTASGKIDRQRLLAEHEASDVGLEAGGELTETERRVQEAWDRVLGGGGHPLDASFFEVGGTSLTVFSLVHRLREGFGLARGDLDAHTVYRLPTIGGLAAHIDHLLAGGAGPAPAATPILVTLRSGTDPSLAPVFFMASAGGAVGSYEKLAKALSTPREVIGVRDPFTFGERDPSLGFDHWVDLYLAAIRERQPSGPYYVGAYSSGGAFGYEVAHRLRQAGEEVALLILIDPIGMDRRTRWRFGWWVLRSTYARLHVRALTRIMGWLRWRPLSQLRLYRNRFAPGASASSPEDTVELAERARTDRSHVLAFSALLELNTGVPYTLEPTALDGVPQERWLDVLTEKVQALTPEIEAETIEGIFLQYPMQVRAQHVYQLKPYDGKVLLVEAVTRYKGLIRAQLRPYVKDLTAKTCRVGEPSEGVREVAQRFGVLGTHFRSMRDDQFVEALARVLDEHLG